MFDWIPEMFLSITTSFWIGYLIGIPVWFLLGILFWMRHIERKEAWQLAKDIEARIAECPDETEAKEVEEVWVRLLKSCDL